MNLHMLCCCGENADPCAPACDCESSYIISGLGGVFNYDASRTGPTPCTTLCDDYDTGNLRSSVQLAIQFTQGQTGALSRVAGTCCYKAFGELTATYQYGLTQQWFCCGQNPSPVCVHTENKTGTVTLDFCYTVVCLPNIYRNGPGWLHSLTICGFCIDNIQVVTQPPTPQECTDGLSCDELPLARYGLCVGGGGYRWATALKCLDAIQRPGDVEYIDFCGPYYDCNVSGGGTPCFEPYLIQQRLMGPFSPYLVAEFTAGNPEPEPCGNTGVGDGPMGTVLTNCTTHKNICTGGYDYQDDCCRAELTYGFSLPYFL